MCGGGGGHWSDEMERLEIAQRMQSSLPTFLEQLYHEDHGVIALTTAVISQGENKNPMHASYYFSEKVGLIP